MSPISFVKSRGMYPFLVGAVTAVFLIPILISLTGLPKLQQYAGYEWIVIPLLPVLFLVGYQVGLLLFGKRAVMREIMRFALIGLSNFAVDTGSNLTLLSFIPVVTSSDPIFWTVNALGVSVAIGNSFFWNRLWTFGEVKQNQENTLIKFLIVSIGAIVINTTVVSVALKLLYVANFPSYAIPTVKVMATVVSMTWNFVGYKYLVFKK